MYFITVVNITSLFLYICIAQGHGMGSMPMGRWVRPYLTGRKQALNGWAQPKKALEIGFLLDFMGLIWMGLDPTDGPIWPDDPCDDESKRSL